MAPGRRRTFARLALLAAVPTMLGLTGGVAGAWLMQDQLRGPEGPQGPPGLIGPQGPQGPQGRDDNLFPAETITASDLQQIESEIANLRLEVMALERAAAAVPFCNAANVVVSTTSFLSDISQLSTQRACLSLR